MNLLDQLFAYTPVNEQEASDKEEMIRLCMAASAGAVTTIGTKPPAKELVERLITEVSFVSYK